MTVNHGWRRREFIKAAGAVAVGGAFGTWSFQARAELQDVVISLGFITDAAATDKKPVMEQRGWLGDQAKALNADLEQQLGAAPGLMIIRGDDAGGYKFTQNGGACLARLATDRMGRLTDRAEQLSALKNDLATHSSVPVMLAVHPPLVAGLTHPDAAMPSSDRKALVAVIKQNPQVVVVLCGKAFANRAAFIEGTGALCLVTCSPLLYPCGARLVEIEVKGTTVTVQSRFVQTRLLDLVEQSFHEAGEGLTLKNLGKREDRTFAATSGNHEIKKTIHELPSVAPEWSGRDSMTFAVVTDTHLCLDKFVNPKSDDDYKMIGHYMEAGSKEILDDVLDEIKAGRHRVEFYDAVFQKDPEAQRNFLELPVDHLHFDGDMFEHGKKEEASEFRARLDALPAGLRAHATVTVGNHDMFRDFSANGPASSRDLIAGFFADYLPQKGETNYVVHLNDWATLIVLDTTIATHSNLGLIQERIDWLDDVLSDLPGRAVMVASHHPLYALSLVPPAMNAYLHTSSHFTYKRSAARLQLHEIFARHNNVKMVISGHYHGTVVDQFKKAKPAGTAADDAFTTHVQVPCTIEYPNGYRLFRLSHAGKRATIEYITAYTRKSGLRNESREAPIFRYGGTEVRVPHHYQGTLTRLQKQETVLGHAAMLDPYDLIDLNVRGFKDGTARAGKGKGGKPNINGKIEVTI